MAHAKTYAPPPPTYLMHGPLLQFLGLSNDSLKVANRDTSFYIGFIVTVELLPKESKITFLSTVYWLFLVIQVINFTFFGV